jgi:lipoprotein-anchoring transpeptidase ErfK/SrfK
MRRRSKVLLTAAVTSAAVVGGVGTAYAAHFQDRALPGSTVGGVSVAGLTRDEVAAVLREHASGVTVTLQMPAGERTEHLADLGYGIDVDATVDAVFAANGTWLSYATSLVTDRGVDAVVQTDPERTDLVVAELVSGAGKVGRDAEVVLSKDKRSFQVVPAVTGQAVERASFQDVVSASARELRSTSAEVSFVDVVPAVTTAEAEKVADQANALVTRTVKVSDGDETHTASKRAKASWVSIRSAEGALGTPSLDVKKLKAWVQKLAKGSQKDPTSGLRYVSARGDELAVITQAVDGKAVSNSAAVAASAAKALAEGRSYAGRFEYRSVPAAWTERRVAAGAENLAYPAAEGEKWIDVDLGRHTMTAYVGADVVKGPVSMVDGAAETPTVVGTFRVYHQNPLMTMRGDNADGTHYETPNVPWSSFFHRGFALHGAPWRSSFGYSASHGCINLPVDVAKWVYDFATVGTTVVSHR